MTARENARRIMKFDAPERVMREIPQYLLCYHGCNHEGFDGRGEDGPVGSRWTDIWGVGWHKEQAGVMGLTYLNPLDEVGKLKSYRWPDPDDERICGRIHETARAYRGGDLFLGGSHRDTLWEKAYMLVGMENMMVYFHTEPGFAREILHRIMDFQLGIAAHYLAAGIEIANAGDDLGTQRSLMLSPRIVEEFLVPEYRRLFDLYRERGVAIAFHSCGHVEPILETLIGLGVDVLNPVQETANDLGRVRAIARGRMALQGGVSSAAVMAGPPARIDALVRERILLLGAGGGYFCAPDQGLPYPAAHVAAFDEAVERHGRYPLAAV
ncbi:MAG: uroporphyrinogen decarboxylase family protein [Patescibacteria group bacterium]